MSDKNFSISIRFDAKTGKVVGQINDVSDALTKTGTASEKSMQTLAKSIQNAGTTLEDLSRKAHAYFFGWQAFQTAGAILKSADQVAQLDQRVKTATRATGDYATVSARLYQIAQQTGTALDSNVALFQSLARVAPEIGATNGQMLALTKTLQQLGRIGGSSQEQMSNAMLQFGQAMAGGVLRAEEFNSIVENTPEVANRIAQGMEMTVGQLRMAVLAGGVLSKDVFDALLKQTAEINAQAAEAAMNMSVGWRMLSTSAANSLSTINSGLGNGIGGVTGLNEHLGRTVSVTELLGMSMGGFSMVLDKIFERTTELERVDREILALKNSINHGVSIFGNTTTDILRQHRELKQLEQERLAILGVVNKLTGGEVGLDLAAEYDAQQKAIYGVFETKEYMQAEEKAWIEALKAYHGEYASELKAQADEQKQATRANADYQAEQEKRWRADIIAFDREYQDELTRQWQDAQTYRQNTINALWDADNRDFDKLDAQDNDSAALVADIEQMALSVDSIGDAWTRTGDAASQAIANMIKTYQEFDQQYKASNKDQEKIDALRFDNLDKLATGVIDLGQFKQNESKLDQKQAELNEQTANNQIALYHGLAGAMSNAFKQGSAEAQVFAGIQQGLALYDGVRAVMNAWAAPFPTNLAMVPLTVANVGALLGQIGVGFNAGTTPAGYDAQQVQAAQGTGTVLGDPTAKSESISNSIDMLADINADQYSELRSIDRGIGQLVTSFEGVAKSIVGAGYGNFSAEFLGVTEGTTGAGGVAGLIDDVSAGIISGLGSAILGGATKKTLTDSGIDLQAANLGEVMASHTLNGLTYGVVQKVKDGGWFGSDKTSYSTIYGALDASVESSFGQTFAYMGNVMVDTADQLGLDIARQINEYDFDLPRISLKGLSSKDQIAEINSVVSAQMDTLADTMLGAITNRFQRIGEGDFETAMRLITDKRVVEDVFELSGQSVAADIYEVSQALVDLAGGVSELRDAAGDYFTAFFSEQEQFAKLTEDLNDQFANMGRELPATREAYRALVEAQNLGIEADRERYMTLLSLSSMADQYYDNLEQGAQAMLVVSTGLVDEAYAALQSAINAEKTALKDALNDRLEALNAEKTAIGQSVSALKQMQTSLENAYRSIIHSTDGIDLMSYTAAQAQILQARETGVFTLDELQGALAVVGQNTESNYTSRNDYLRDQAITANALADLSAITATQLSAEEQMQATLDEQLALTRENTQSQMAALDAQLDHYQAQIHGQSELLTLTDAIKQLDAAILGVLQDIAGHTANTFDAIAGQDELIDWSEFASAFEGVATEQTLQKVFSQLDINGDKYVDAIESIIGGLQGSQYTESDIKSYIDTVLATNDWDSATQIITGAALSTGTTAAQIATATQADVADVQQVMYTAASAIDAKMRELTGNGDIDIANANAGLIYDYAVRNGLSAAKVASYVPQWSTQHVNEYVAYMGWSPLPQFAAGGFTADIPADQIAGVVHGGEYVAPNWQLKKHPELFETLEAERANKPLPGYANGGLVGGFNSIKAIKGIGASGSGDTLLHEIKALRSDLSISTQGNNSANSKLISLLKDIDDRFDTWDSIGLPNLQNTQPVEVVA